MALNRLNDLIPMLMCDDVQASIEFYTNVLSFSVVSPISSHRCDGIGLPSYSAVSAQVASETFP